MFSSILLNHADRPRNQTLIEGANLDGVSSYPPCGDQFRLTLKVVDGIVLDAGFQAKACGATTAFASFATETIKGLSLETVMGWDSFHWEKLAGGLPPSKRHVILLFIASLREAKQTERGA